MFERFKQRSYELERLDTGDYTPEEYRRWQREMYFIHRIFGEHRALRRSMLRDIQASKADRVSILDVGAGSGELLDAVGSWLQNRKTFLVGLEIEQTAVSSIQEKGIDTVRANALELPFADGGFDIVFCTLFLHHLADDEALQLLKEMSRVARKRIYAVDLNRDPVAYYLYRIIGRPLLQPFTLDDGALSILRSFTANELAGLAADAGLSEVKVQRSRANRLILSGR